MSPVSKKIKLLQNKKDKKQKTCRESFSSVKLIHMNTYLLRTLIKKLDFKTSFGISDYHKVIVHCCYLTQ